jgi:hypothetical protein
MGTFSEFLREDRGRKQRSNQFDVGTLEGLQSLAASRGIQTQADKPGLFSRTMDLLQRGTFASAGAAKALIRGDENVIAEAWKGLTGQEKETYADVLKEAGFENKYARGALGFALDIALDPTTYFGGALIKGGAKAAGKAARPVGRVVQRAAPDVTESLVAAGGNLKDALGKAFVYGYGTSKGLSDDVSRTINQLAAAKDDIIDTNLDFFKGFSKRELNEAGEIMMDNRRLELGARQSDTPLSQVKFKSSSNPRVNTAIGLMKTKGRDLARKAGLDPDDAYANYIPFLRTDKLNQQQAFNLNKILQQGKKGYTKKFNDLIKDENLLKKPIEAYTRREVEIARDAIARQSLDDIVKTYGQTFKNEELARAAGYVPMKDKKFGKTVGYLKESDANFINNFLYPEMRTLDTLAKATGYDAMTRWFKTAVTAYFPSFHARNMVSGMVQNYSVLGREAFNPKNHNAALAILKNADGFLNVGGKSFKIKDLNKAFQDHFGVSSRYISDIGDAIEQVTSSTFRAKKLSKARQLGNWIESQQKATAMAAALRKGHTLDEALKIAERAGFDYSKITKFESSVMRRLIPFYTFARKNAELQGRTLIKNPERILNQIKFTNNLSEVFGGRKPTEEELKGLPPWALSGLGFKLEGDRFLTKFGLPIEEFIERVDKPGASTLSALNPLVKYPVESKLGYDFFRERALTDITKMNPKLAEAMPDYLKELMNVRSYKTEAGETRYTASPEKLHLLRNLPTARLQSTLERMFDDDLTTVDKALAFVTGARIYDVDMELQKYFREKDLREEIESELLREGTGKIFKTFYLPDNQ